MYLTNPKLRQEEILKSDESCIEEEIPLLAELNNHTLDSAGTFWQYWCVVVCGGDFTGEMISRIQAKVNAEPDLSRRQLSPQVCQSIGWRKGGGGLKCGSWRKALARLDR